MGTCTRFRNHDLHINPNGMIRCKRCDAMWDLHGQGYVPQLYDSWKAWKRESLKQHRLPGSAPELALGGCPLPERELCSVLADDLIERKGTTDPIEIKTIRYTVLANHNALTEPEIKDFTAILKEKSDREHAAA